MTFAVERESGAAVLQRWLGVRGRCFGRALDCIARGKGAGLSNKGDSNECLASSTNGWSLWYSERRALSCSKRRVRQAIQQKHVWVQKGVVGGEVF